MPELAFREQLLRSLISIFDVDMFILDAGQKKMPSFITRDQASYLIELGLGRIPEEGDYNMIEITPAGKTVYHRLCDSLWQEAGRLHYLQEQKEPSQKPVELEEQPQEE